MSMDGGVGLWNQKLSSLIDPGPASTFVFLDEREDSINDVYFNIGDIGTINDFPASYHLAPPVSPLPTAIRKYITGPTNERCRH